MATEDPIPSRSEIHLFATGEPRRGLFRFFPPPAARAELWASLVFIVLSLVGAAWVIQCLSEALALEQDSVNVEAKVVNLRMTKKKHWHYEVGYEYPAPPEMDARSYRNKTELPKEHFDRLKEGGPIAVKVCRTDPANHQVVGERPRFFSSTAALLFCLGLLALLALVGVRSLPWWWICRRKPGPA